MTERNDYPVWPGWETVSIIGRGSYGSVYQITRDVFGHVERAAMKVISVPQNKSEIEDLLDIGYSQHSVTETFKEHLQDILREYSLMREMNGHSNVVSCDDVLVVQHDDGVGWDILIRMELLTPLTKALDPANIERQTMKIGKDMCRALTLCRSHDIIHRDIKPQNIFVSPNGDYKLGDFGVARTMERTTGGTKVGTYEYMAPEVYNNQPYGASADIYSLGMVLYWLLNDRRGPFLPPASVRPSANDLAMARERRFDGEQLPPPAHGSMALQRIVLKACSFDPADRYKTAEEMLSELEGADRPERYGIDDNTVDGTVRAEPDRTPVRRLPDLTGGPAAGSAVGKVPAGGGKPAAKFPKKWIIAGAGALLLILVLVLALGNGGSDTAAVQTVKSAAPTAAPTPSPTPSPTPAPTAVPIDYGTCGDNCFWGLSADGVLTIEGTGNMNGYSYSSDNDSVNTPWFSHKDEITRVVIREGVTNIGGLAFYNCANMTDIEIPSSVTSIGDWSFRGCVGLKSLTIPDGVSSIGTSAFLLCENLDNIRLPSGLKSIGGSAFYKCYNLASIVIPDGVTKIEPTTFCNCTNLKSVTIPTGVTSIEDKAFFECTNLAGISIPAGVTRIGYASFYRCAGLKRVAIPEGVTTIDTWAFGECTGLTSVVIPDGVTTIGEYAFKNCSSLTSIVIPKGVQRIENWTFGECPSLTSVTFSDGVTTIGYASFYNCSGLTSVTIPASVAVVEDYAFGKCLNLKDVYYAGSEAHWDSISILTYNEPLTSAAIHCNS